MFPYKYTIVDISENNEIGLKAIIPSFPNIYIVADSPSELHNAVQEFVKEDIAYRKKHNKNIPLPDNIQQFSGNFTLRINPSLHKRIAELAQSRDISVNKYVGKVLQEELVR
jgi:antitoxin HicB